MTVSPGYTGEVVYLKQRRPFYESISHIAVEEKQGHQNSVAQAHRATIGLINTHHQAMQVLFFWQGRRIATYRTRP
jgi:hypothetical protein